MYMPLGKMLIGEEVQENRVLCKCDQSLTLEPIATLGILTPVFHQSNSGSSTLETLLAELLYL